MIYTFGDTHGNHDIGKLFNGGIEFKENDYIIICGDFGVIWNDEKDIREITLESTLNSLPCEVLFVDGNHENFNRIYALPQVQKFDSIVGQYSKNVFHLKRGHIYNIDNMNFLTMGGALSIDKQWRVEGISWWRQEAITDAELEQIFLALQEKKCDVKAWICGHWHSDVAFDMKYLPRKKMSFYVNYNGISVAIDKDKKAKEIELK